MTISPRPLLTLRSVSAVLLISLLSVVSWPTAARAADWKERPTRYTVILYQPEQSNVAEQLAGIVDPVVEQVAALHDYTVRRPLTIRLHNSVETYAQSSELAKTSYGQIVQATSQGTELALAEPRMRNLTPEQVRNLFRRGLAQLMLEELGRNRLPIGLLQGASLYTEHNTAEAEVGMRVVEKARRERALLSWTELNTPARFTAQTELAAPQSYAVVAFLLDRYGLAAWQRLLTALRSGTGFEAAMPQAYGRPAAALESEWQDYLGEYIGGSFQLNHFNRYDLAGVRTHAQAGRYQEAGDELTAIAKFIGGAGRTAKENEIRELAKQVEVGLEAGNQLLQGQTQMAAFQYSEAKAAFDQARGLYEQLGVTSKVEEADKAMAAANSGVTALEQLAVAEQHMAELRYNEAQAAAQSAVKTFAELGDEEHYRQTMAILNSLSSTQARLAYLVAGVGILFVGISFWRLRWQARRQTVPGVLR